MSAAVETPVGILKRVMVTPAIYPHFFNFFTLTEHWVHTVMTLVMTAE